ncbi:hypothetical protein D9758_003699 [Tetrapyrgos nigripes]|uniref:EKC/KEOPS complex subunit CGI121 n=1 Tax=Tetrapyrgos nigripes TaxID=182062 RepID=A0A8H5GMB7_9AGAR|nr:hypothetical protein D9758_003699 [Tetrapyrgos nigripes]
MLITEAIRRYGVSDTTKSLLVVHITNQSLSLESVEKKMKGIVSGDMLPFGELGGITDWDRVKKYYKLDKEVKDRGDAIAQRAFTDNVVISSVAMKSVMQ